MAVIRIQFLTVASSALYHCYASGAQSLGINLSRPMTQTVLQESEADITVETVLYDRL